MPVNASTVTINASIIGHTIPDSLWGDNLASWEASQNGTDTVTNKLFIASGRRHYRWPGGSWSDDYIWDDMQYGDKTWIVSYEQALNLLDIIGGAKMQPIVNGSGYWNDAQHTLEETVQKAAEWVRDLNITRGLGAENWEIGNEIYGNWERGYTTGPDYGERYVAFYRAMKAVDPTIKIGAAATPYDGIDGNGYNYWMRDMLTVIKNNGIIPDFLIVHDYPYYFMEYSQESNVALLGESGVGKIAVQHANLDAMVSQYLGSQYVGQVRYAFTEFNADGMNGGQNPMYLTAMFIAQDLMEMAIRGWTIAQPWQAAYYTNGGVVRPTWYIYPLLISNFGKNLVNASSSDALVRAYASKDDSGNLTIFMVNNSPTDAADVQINISGFNAAGDAQQWLMLPAGSAGSYAFESTDLQVNGIVHPDTDTIRTLAGQAFTAGNCFSYNLPAAGMVIMKLVPAGS